EKADLRCGPGPEGPFAPCDKSNLVVGTRVAAAEHAVNQYGHDVWTAIDLVVADPTTAPAEQPAAPPAAPPAPEQHPAPPPAAVVDSLVDGLLSVHRLNNDEKPSARLADNVSIACLTVEDGKL